MTKTQRLVAMILAACLTGCGAAPAEVTLARHATARTSVAQAAKGLPTASGAIAQAFTQGTDPGATGGLAVAIQVHDGDAPGAKPYLQGVMDRAGRVPAGYAEVVDALVANADWKDLQPTAGGPIAENNAIDQAIAMARRANAEHPGLGMRLKLRVYAGIHAPEWAKALGGGAVAIDDPTDGVAGTVGRWWTDAYRQAYADLQARLAAKYDQVPEIASVVVSGAATVYSETMIRQVGSTDTRAHLLAAGYTTAADQAAIRGQIDAAAVWKRTNVEMSFNPYQTVTADGKSDIDLAFTLATMDYGRARFGTRFVLANNSLTDNADGSLGRGGAYAAMYDHMRELGRPISIQTATAARMHSLGAVLELALGIGASVVELPYGYAKPGSNAYLSPEALGAYDARLEGR